ncbi:hypothetical protein OBBRIDRAFT_790737 [Obba rivulosa]|uniref:Uncharacterized protein n=1 Tax=Obba rivulosa TaxID=1052685 RepID=A0A8E2B2L3_9APHY|nr:hypothetical protein OBBRIDRAFT_790737 [Obba rivulosa]
MQRMLLQSVEFFCLVLSLLACISVVIAIPAFDGVTSWSSVGSLVPGISALEALGPSSKKVDPGTLPYFMSIHAPRGLPGNMTVYRNRSPPLFYIYGDQLYHYHNDSTILPVNVYNTTGAQDLPLQIKAGTMEDGVKGGIWRWQGTMLQYERGTQTNQGLFYHCDDPNGLKGLFLFLQCSAPPPGCTPFTIHSWSRR